jgi:hypothetical protein
MPMSVAQGRPILIHRAGEGSRNHSLPPHPASPWQGHAIPLHRGGPDGIGLEHGSATGGLYELRSD